MKVRLLALLLGPAPWGAVDVWPSRYGYAHIRLTVYPPGTDPGGRFRLRLWRSWPTTVCLAGLALCVAAAAAGLNPLEDAVVGLAAAVATLLGLAALSRGVRPLVRIRCGATETTERSVRLIGDMALIEQCWDRLAEADLRLLDGALTPAQHELVWSQVWADLAEAPAAGESRRRRTRRPPHPQGAPVKLR